MNYSKDFTLTVKAVNDAPIVLHSLEELYLPEGAAMVLNTFSLTLNIILLSSITQNSGIGDITSNNQCMSGVMI